MEQNKKASNHWNFQILDVGLRFLLFVSLPWLKIFCNQCPTSALFFFLTNNQRDVCTIFYPSESVAFFKKQRYKARYQQTPFFGDHLQYLALLLAIVFVSYNLRLNALFS